MSCFKRQVSLARKVDELYTMCPKTISPCSRQTIICTKGKNSGKNVISHLTKSLCRYITAVYACYSMHYTHTSSANIRIYVARFSKHKQRTARMMVENIIFSRYIFQHQAAEQCQVNIIMTMGSFGMIPTLKL